MNYTNDVSVNKNNQQIAFNKFFIVNDLSIINNGSQGNYLKQPNNNLFKSTFSKNPNIEQLKDIIGSKKNIYGHGLESQRLNKLPHYNQPFDKLEILIKLGRPNKRKMNELGEMYNENFREEIEKRIYPKYGRNEKRSMSLSVWFFEDHKEYIIPWLKKKGEIT